MNKLLLDGTATSDMHDRKSSHPGTPLPGLNGTVVMLYRQQRRSFAWLGRQ
jgi:hypothetical protein